MKYLFLLIFVLISGCSSKSVGHQVFDVAIGKVFEKATNTDVSYNAANCPNVKRTCSHGKYREWFQKNGKKACACNK
jgi:hypothetical protein